MDSFDPDWMWERARALLERTGQSSRRFVEPSSARRAAWEPPVDVFETPHDFWVLVAVPGVDPSRIRVVLEGTRLHILGDRPQPKALQSALVHRLEIPYGRFERRMSLPDGRYELGSTRSSQGCVVIQITKCKPGSRPGRRPAQR